MLSFDPSGAVRAEDGADLGEHRGFEVHAEEMEPYFLGFVHKDRVAEGSAHRLELLYDAL